MPETDESGGHPHLPTHTPAVSSVTSATGARSHRRGKRPSLSLSIKLPLLAGGLVLVVAIAIAAASYVALRSSLREAAAARLETLTSRMSQSYSNTAPQQHERALTRAARPALTRYLVRPEAARTEAAMAALSEGTQRRSQPFVAELRDSALKVVLSTRTAPAIDSATDTLAIDSTETTTGVMSLTSMSGPLPPVTDSAVIGRFRAHNDSLFYPVVAAIGNPALGYVVEWHLVQTSSEAREAFSTLLGSGAVLYMGNRDGTAWTDLESITSAPSGFVADTAMIEYDYPDERGGVFARSVELPGTPWVMVVEFSRSAVYAPADRFLQQLMMIALASVALGLLAAWFLSRRITAPLRRLTDDTLGLSPGTHRLPAHRVDEIERLRMAFDQMAWQVTEARLGLEEQVHERTGELHEAMKQLEAAHESLVRREKLALMGQLSSSIGHELRNPLGVMSNAIYYLEQVQADAPDQVKRHLKLIRQQVVLSTKIVSDLLDFTRASEPTGEAMSLHSLVQAQLERLVIPDNIEVDLDVPDDLPLAMIDPVHAGQILLNLLTNAVQAMGNQPGTLTVQGRLKGWMLELEVADTGPGVAVEDREQIFEPLFSTKARGIGLGLAVSRSLAQTNGGELRLVSGPGEGARFVISMPRVGGK